MYSTSALEAVQNDIAVDCQKIRDRLGAIKIGIINVVN